jgi:hypothetical protein
LALKLHFTRDDYDFFKFNGQTKASYETFIQRNDKYFFIKAARKYGDSIVDFFVSNFISSKSPYIKDFNQEAHLDRQKRIDGISYYFETDMAQLLRKSQGDFNKIFKITRGQHPILVKTYMAKRVTLETLCVLQNMFNYIKDFDKHISDTIIWPQLKTKILKYKPFLQYNETKLKLKLKEMV